ncbi:MAG: EamA family transporter [Flavobacteriales bacterium]|nr:EamA family transporter [Flavobacteriales bacterium]
MIYILLCILATSSLYIIFKSFERYKVSTNQAIVINYLAAFILGYTTNDLDFTFQEVFKADWFIASLILGICFFAMFNMIGLSSVKLGVSITSLFNKLSLVIPVALGFFLYNDNISTKAIIGMVLGIVSILFVVNSPKLKIGKSRFLLFLLLIQFFGPGLIDSLVKYSQEFLVTKHEFSLFSAVTFFCAFAFGLTFTTLRRKQLKPDFRTILGGLILGVVNYGTIYFMLRSLNSGLESSKVFMIINLGIIILTSISGIFLFKEGFSKIQYIGFLLALVSCYLIL